MKKRKQSAPLKQSRAEKLLTFLQWIEEQTIQEKFPSGSLAFHMKTFEVSYYNEVGIILREKLIVETINLGQGKGSVHKYCSEVKPNIKMAEAVMDASLVYSANRGNKKNSDENKLTGIQQARQAGVLQEEKKSPQLPVIVENKISPCSDDLFDILQKIQLIANINGAISTEEISRIINKKMIKNPALKKAYLHHLNK